MKNWTSKYKPEEGLFPSTGMLTSVGSGPKVPTMRDGGPGPEEQAFQKFFGTLPINLRSDKPDYNIRGYWDALGRPTEFDYSQPKENDGYYHAFSRNPETGEILKAPFHSTFKHAINEDRKAGYFPIVTPDGKIKTVSGNDLKPGQSVYAYGGDISIPNVYPEYKNGGGLLSRTVTCSNCGWSWKAVDGGKDPLTCHKCGGIIKMKQGGLTNNWTDKYKF